MKGGPFPATAWAEGPQLNAAPFPPIISLLAAPGGTIGYTFSWASIAAWIRHGPGVLRARANVEYGSVAVVRS